MPSDNKLHLGRSVSVEYDIQEPLHGNTEKLLTKRSKQLFGGVLEGRGAGDILGKKRHPRGEAPSEHFRRSHISPAVRWLPLEPNNFDSNSSKAFQWTHSILLISKHCFIEFRALTCNPCA